MTQEEDQEPISLATAAPADDGDLKRGVSFPEHLVDKRPAAAHSSSSFGRARPPRPPHELRRRHTDLGRKEQQQKRVLKSHSSRGPGVGFLHRLKTSFRLELEKRQQRGPSLARLASGWSESPHPFPDGGMELPEPPRFDPESSEAKRLCVPGTGWRHRLLLVSASCVGFGGYFTRNILSAVSADLIVDFGMTRETYGALSGLPAIPNIVFGPLGGVVTDWIGADKSALLYSVIVVLGSALSSIAVPLRSTQLLGLSQILLGVGRGTLGTAQKVFLKLATDHDEVSFYFSLAFSISHLGTFLAFFVEPAIARASSAGYATCVWFSTGVTLLSLLCAIPLIGKLRHIQPLLNVLEDEGDGDESELEEAEEGAMIPVTDDEASAPAVQLQTIYSGETSGPPQAPAEDEEEEEEEAKAAMPGEQGGGGGAGAGAPAAAPVVGCFSRVWSGLAQARAGFVRVFGDLLTWPFFLFLVACLMFYLAFAPTESWGVYYLSKERHYDSGQASLGTSMIPACSVFLGPAFGALVDKELWRKGKPGPLFRRLYPPGATQLLSMLLTAAGLLVITLDPAHWLVGFSLVSLAYAMACSALWILVPEFVPVASLGLAFSICHVINDVIIMVFETRIGHALDQGKTFQDAILPLMVGFSLLATLATLLLMRPLRQRAEWNAALAAQGEAEGRRGAAAEGIGGLQTMGSLGGSVGDLYD